MFILLPPPLSPAHAALIVSTAFHFGYSYYFFQSTLGVIRYPQRIVCSYQVQGIMIWRILALCTVWGSAAGNIGMLLYKRAMSVCAPTHYQLLAKWMVLSAIWHVQAMILGPLTIKHLGEKNLVGHLYSADFHAVFDDFVIVKGKIKGVKDARFLRRPGSVKTVNTKLKQLSVNWSLRQKRLRDWYSNKVYLAFKC